MLCTRTKIWRWGRGRGAGLESAACRLPASQACMLLALVLPTTSRLDLLPIMTVPPVLPHLLAAGLP